MKEGSTRAPGCCAGVWSLVLYRVVTRKAAGWMITQHLEAGCMTKWPITKPGKWQMQNI